MTQFLLLFARTSKIYWIAPFKKTRIRQEKTLR